MKVDFYYWNYQCPINYETIMMLKKFENSSEINYYDISSNTRIAAEKNIYFPFLTIFNDSTRWRGPLSIDIIKRFQGNQNVIETPYIIKLGEEKVCGEIVELNSLNINLIADKCTMNHCCEACSNKLQFLSGKCDDFIGYLHLCDGKVIGGAEYMPSIKVPYNIPKDEATAFLTCLYHSSEQYDYKAYPLERLEEKLSEKYRRLIAISGEQGTFPNGDLKWFLDRGYTDEGVISIEDNYSVLHMVSKKFPSKSL